jgi:hypothetical protein
MAFCLSLECGPFFSVVLFVGLVSILACSACCFVGSVRSRLYLLYVHGFAGSPPYDVKGASNILCASSLVNLWPHSSSSQNRWMMLRHTLGSLYAHFQLVMDTY